MSLNKENSPAIHEGSLNETHLRMQQLPSTTLYT